MLWSFAYIALYCDLMGMFFFFFHFSDESLKNFKIRRSLTTTSKIPVTKAQFSVKG